MRNILTIVRRDLAAYFTSPIGYIFLIVFLVMSVGLYITSFFTFPVADMRGFFNNLPILLCVFIPAVTMRVWAEERKENTWEMLLTFPMKAFELVLGKFIATLIFYVLALACTITVPIMLSVLGDPDGGAMFGGYFGALLLGALFLAIGIFFSGLCKDQIVAFVVSLLVCFGVFLLGTNFIASYIDGLFSEGSALAGLGTLLSQVVGVVDHYSAFTRGVVDIVDVCYFAGWTVLFLVLNILYIDGRNRRGARLTFGSAVALCVAIGLAFNWLVADLSFGRFDLTEGKVYTVSEASARILRQLDVPVQVKLYVTRKDKMPTGLTTLEQDITDKLNELRVASGGKVEFTPVYLEVANLAQSERSQAGPEGTGEGAKSEADTIEKRMLDKGLEPFAVRAIGQDQVTSKYIYSSLGVAYKDKPEEIVPQIMPENLPELEYRLVSTVYKLSRAKAPVVALVAPKEAVNIPPEMRQLYEQMGQPVPSSEDPFVYLEELLRYEKYEVKRVDLSKESPLPDEYDTLVVVNPRELSDRQRWEINRALLSGKSVIMAVQQYTWDYQSSRTGISLFKREQNPEANPLLEKYGLGVDKAILMDVNHVPLTIQSSNNPLAGLLGMGQTVNLPIQILVNSSSMNSGVSITNRLANLLYIWGTALTVNDEDLKKYNLEKTVLVETSDRAWTVPPEATPADLQNAFQNPADTGQRYPLMVMVAGQFPDAYKDAPRPAWPPSRPTPGRPPMPDTPEDSEVKPVTPAPGKLILLGCAEMFTKSFAQAGTGNLDVFLNSVDAVTLGDDLVNVRGQKPVDRTIDMPSPAARAAWKAVNYGLVSTLIAITGIAVTMLRRRARNAYTMSFAEAK